MEQGGLGGSALSPPPTLLPAGPGQSPGGGPGGKIPGKFRVFNPKDTLDRLISIPFQKQIIKKEHNINAHSSQNFAYLVFRVPFWQFCVNFERQIAYEIGLHFVIV